MDRRTVSIVGAIIVVGGLFAFAGDLDPPEGPIGPTMHTLDEIHELVADLQPGCPNCMWTPASAVGGQNTHVFVANGPGVLHKVWLTNGTVRLMSGPKVGEGDLIFELTPTPGLYELDVAFDATLWVDAVQGIQMNVLYRTIN